MSKELLKMMGETAETLLKRVVKNHAIHQLAFAEADEDPVTGMVATGDVETELGTLYYKLEVSDESFDHDSGLNSKNGDLDGN